MTGTVTQPRWYRAVCELRRAGFQVWRISDRQCVVIAPGNARRWLAEPPALARYVPLWLSGYAGRGP